MAVSPPKLYCSTFVSYFRIFEMLAFFYVLDLLYCPEFWLND